MKLNEKIDKVKILKGILKIFLELSRKERMVEFVLILVYVES